jgi:hypothetical protein
MGEKLPFIFPTVNRVGNGNYRSVKLGVKLAKRVKFNPKRERITHFENFMVTLYPRKRVWSQKMDEKSANDCESPPIHPHPHQFSDSVG